jgi:hypothetical protein
VDFTSTSQRLELSVGLFFPVSLAGFFKGRCALVRQLGLLEFAKRSCVSQFIEQLLILLDVDDDVSYCPFCSQ